MTHENKKPKKEPDPRMKQYLTEFHITAIRRRRRRIVLPITDSKYEHWVIKNSTENNTTQIKKKNQLPLSKNEDLISRCHSNNNESVIENCMQVSKIGGVIIPIATRSVTQPFYPIQSNEKESVIRKLPSLSEQLQQNIESVNFNNNNTLILPPLQAIEIESIDSTNKSKQNEISSHSISIQSENNHSPRIYHYNGNFINDSESPYSILLSMRNDSQNNFNNNLQDYHHLTDNNNTALYNSQQQQQQQQVILQHNITNTKSVDNSSIQTILEPQSLHPLFNKPMGITPSVNQYVRTHKFPL